MAYIKFEIKETGDFYPDFGIYKIITGSGENQTDYVNNYTSFKTKDCEQNAIYVVKAQAPLNTDAHANLQVQLNSGKLTSFPLSKSTSVLLNKVTSTASTHSKS